MLASVTTPQEAESALRAGADLIDAKDPSRGALGDLPTERVTQIVTVAAGSGRATSATVGDLPMHPETVCAAVSAMSETGVGYVKIGFLPEPGAYDVAGALSGHARAGQPLVGVLFADRSPDFGLIDALAEAGFAGVMLDTAGKARGRLRDFLDDASLAGFLRTARNRGMFAGLAGSLSVSDIAPLTVLEPDILGFRGALCLDRTRTFGLSETLVGEVRAAIDARCGSLAGRAR